MNCFAYKPIRATVSQKLSVSVRVPHLHGKGNKPDLPIKRIYLFHVVPRYAGVCGHMEYPCRFQNASATTQEIIPHRVFAPVCLKGACQETLLPLIPPCLSAAHSVLGTHPFSRLDVLIVPANFPSLGMARYVVLLWLWGSFLTTSCFP